MKIPMNAVMGCVEAVLRGYARRATKYLDDHTIVRATALGWYKNRAPRKNARTSGLVLTVGAPNYRERKFIRLCKDAGEPFPVKKIQWRRNVA